MNYLTFKFYLPAVGLALTILTGCGGVSVKNAEVNDLSWLKGEWKGNNEQVQVHSRYTQLSGKSISGSSYIMQSQDTTDIRAYSISKTEGKLILSLRTQQNQTAVGYELSSIGNKTAVFKNEEAQYPRSIHYKLEKETLTIRWKGPDKEQTFQLTSP